MVHATPPLQQLLDQTTLPQRCHGCPGQAQAQPRRHHPRRASEMRHHLAEGPPVYRPKQISLHLRRPPAAQLVPFVALLPGDLDRAEMLPSPRLLSTHLPLPLLPPAVSTLGCRIVCVCREPKDAFLSRWHFEKKLHQGISLGMDEAFAMFSEGCTPYSPFWDRYLEYWKESLARPREVMFLRYEEIMSDTPKVIRKLASFLGPVHP
uniref:Sulfotransferase n=1 Tax=Triticum urartu TaxID=4572 RepID=A0A8R7V6F3_TRIUA